MLERGHARAVPFYSLAFVLALLCVGFFYKAGQDEMRSGFLWGGLSLVLSMLVIVTFGGGMGMVLLSQLALLAGITFYRVWRDPE